MGIRLRALDPAGFERLPAHARGCVFWEVDPSAAVRTSEFDKEAWLRALLEWGSCGQLAESGPNVVRTSGAGSAPDNWRTVVVGTAFYAPPPRVPAPHTSPPGR